MALNFPSSPTIGQTYTSSGKSWTWDGSSWTANSSVELSLSSSLKTVNNNSLVGIGDVSVGTVTSVGGTGTVAGLSLSGSVTTSGNLTLAGTLSTPVSTINDSTTVGQNLVKLTNPTAITFLRVNADNTVSALDAATFRGAIGAGTSSTVGTVTSVGGTGTVAGLSLSGSVTNSGNLTLAGTLEVIPNNFASQTANTILAAPNGAAGPPTFRSIVAQDLPNTSVTAGSYTSANITVDAQGRITSATNGGGTTITVSATAPSSPSAGSLWWDSEEGKLKIYYNDGNSSQWVDASSNTFGDGSNITVGTTAPSSPAVNDLWVDTN